MLRSPSAIRMTLAVLLFASLLALGAFTLILRTQRNNNDAAATTAAETALNTQALAVPTLSDRRTEFVVVDGVNVQLDILNSKDMLTQADWSAQNQPAPVQVEQTPVVDPNQIQPTPTFEPAIVATIDPALVPTTPPIQATTSALVPANVEKILFKAYTVVQGDSLYGIALANNSAIELMALHGVDANDLVPGNIIERLPYANPAYCPGYLAYVVRDHDTVFSIARTRNTTVDVIAQLNRLDANRTIYAADVICIP
ncbi:MAG: LysM peptidoglycan-binding domain-containing protein [Chloroflexi bacterium]|nr:LysM peptidoglycan-binding domain-containing protein [Chloroflexota bacterium]